MWRFTVTAFKLLVVPVGLAALAWNLPSGAGAGLAGSDAPLLLAAVLANQMALALFALRMRQALHAFRIEIGFMQAMRVHLQSMFYFFALPMTVGLEIARFTKIRNAARDQPNAAPLTLALLADRMLGALAALALGSALLPFMTMHADVAWNATWAACAIAAAVIAPLAWPWARRRFGDRLRASTAMLKSAGPGLLAASATAIATHAVFAAAVWLAARAAHVEITFMQTLFFVSAAMLFVVIPLSFAGVSPVEAAGFGILVAMGIAPQEAGIVVLMTYLAKVVAAFEGAAWEMYEGGWDALRMLSSTNKAER